MARSPAKIAISEAFAAVLADWLESNGLDHAATPPSSASTAPQLAIEQWQQRVRAAVARRPGPARGLEIGSFVRLSHVGPLGYMAVNTGTLREFLRTYLLLEKWFYGMNWATATFDDTGCGIAWDARFGFPDRLLEQLHAAALATILRTACPTAGSPLQVDFMNAEAGEAQSYATAFGCPVRFDAPALRFVFSEASLAAPIDVASPALDTAWRSRQRTLREALPEATAFARAVQSAILLHLPEGAPTDAAAASLHLSRRTLQRRLAEHGCTYRLLLDGIREKHAQQLLNDPRLSLEEIAFLLGYAEQSAFNHAYRRWTGTAPLRTRP